MKHFIYKTSDFNGNYYIGRHSTDNINDGYQGSGNWIKKCQKVGIKLLTEIIEYCDTVDNLKEIEHQYLVKYINDILNRNEKVDSDGWTPETSAFFGEKNGMFGKKHSDKTIAKMRANRKDKNIGHTRNKGVNNPNYGKTRSEETKNKISEALKGRKMTPEHIAKTRRKPSGIFI